jgi:ketosteroid isomerase-like protein
MNTNALAIKAAYDATAYGDFAPLMDLLADEVHWHATGPGPLAGEYTGKQDIGRFFVRMGETYGDTFRLRVLDVLSSDEHVVVLTSEQGSYRGDQVAWRSAHVFTFENGRCVRFLSFQDDPFNAFWLAEPAESSRL